MRERDATPHALLVEDNPNELNALQQIVAAEGFTTSVAATLADARRAVANQRPDVVLCDICLPDGSGTELLADLRPQDVEIVLVTGNPSVDTAVAGLRLGAFDYLRKPLNLSELRRVLASAVHPPDRPAPAAGPVAGGRLICRCAPMLRVLHLVERVAPSNATVLVIGESGTGKELVAETIHQLSARRDGPFVPLNCGAVAPTVIESELFGHERGSFTGADRLHRGYFERAADGTLLLDEITEMPIELQVRLLRAIETGEVTRVGGERATRVDTRVIAATNREPEEAVADGSLRQDLYYRLKVFPIHVPPLRERGGAEVVLLAQHALERLNTEGGEDKRFHPDTLSALVAYPWPGNVRELMNAVQTAFLLAGDVITPDALAAGVGPASGGPPLRLEVGMSIAEAERRLILSTLEHFNGDKRKVAATLGVSLKTLYNRLNEYRS